MNIKVYSHKYPDTEFACHVIIFKESFDYIHYECLFISKDLEKDLLKIDEALISKQCLEYEYSLNVELSFKLKCLMKNDISFNFLKNNLIQIWEYL